MINATIKPGNINSIFISVYFLLLDYAAGCLLVMVHPNGYTVYYLPCCLCLGFVLQRGDR